MSGMTMKHTKKIASTVRLKTLLKMMEGHFWLVVLRSFSEAAVMLVQEKRMESVGIGCATKVKA